MEIKYSGKPVEKELARLVRLGMPLTPYIIALWILLFAAALFGVITHPENGIYYYPWLIGLVVGALYWILIPSLSASRIIKQNEDFQNVISGVITEQRITIQTLHALSEAQWGLFQSAVISPDAILLYQTKVVYNFFLRSQFASDADWQSFIALIRQNVRKCQARSTSHLPVVSGNKAQVIIVGLLFLAIILMLIYNFSNTGSH